MKVGSERKPVASNSAARAEAHPLPASGSPPAAREGGDTSRYRAHLWSRCDDHREVRSLEGLQSAYASWPFQHARPARAISALAPIATELLRRGDPPLCGRNGHWHI